MMGIDEVKVGIIDEIEVGEDFEDVCTDFRYLI